ncbi:Ankyrin-2 [Orbilia brochopaga]|nr:Ankyrin-2 [Drechslerella brochopaga]
MAGTPSETIDRGDVNDRALNVNPPAYRCNHPPSAASPLPPASMHISRAEGLDSVTRHHAIETASNQPDGEIGTPDVAFLDSVFKCAACAVETFADSDLPTTLASLQDQKPSLPRPDDVTDERIPLYRSKVVDGLSRGDWSAAESSLATLTNDLDVIDSPDIRILEAMVHNSKARWREALDVLDDFEHQSVSEPELSARAYYAKAIALYKLTDFEASHMNSRRGLSVVDRFLEGPLQLKYRSAFGDLAHRTLSDLGQQADITKTELYKSLVPADHTPDPILFVTPVQQDIPHAATPDGDTFDTDIDPQQLPEDERVQLCDLMQQHRLTFGHDGKILVGRHKDFFNALHDALAADCLPLMTLICSIDHFATKPLRDSPISFDLEPPMPQYAWRATTLLHVVAGSKSRYSAAMAEILLDRGADPQQTLFEGITPLHVCARQTNAEVAAVLIRRGADIEARSITGKPPIHFAAWKASWNADVRILKMLIAAGANINAKNSGGYTALHWCMFDGRSAAPIDVLLRRPEIDRFVRAVNHKTPWDIFWEHEEELMRKGEEKRVQILYTLRRYGITR